MKTLTLFSMSCLLTLAASAGEWVGHNEGTPLGATIADIVVHPSDGNIAYALTGVDGVYKTTDRGSSWTAATSGIVLPATGHSLTMDPNDPETIYAVAGDGATTATQGSRLYKTTDGAETWTEITGTITGCASAPTSLSLLGVTVDPFDSGRLVAGQELSSGCGDRGIHLSTDGGVTWSPVTHTGLTNDFWPMTFDPFVPDRLYANVVYRGLARSDDTGTTWTRHPTDGSDILPGAVVPHPGIADRIFQAGADTLRLSTDGGMSWVQVLGPETAQSVAFAPSDGIVGYAITDAGVFRSSDAGDIWALAATSTGRKVAIDPADPDFVWLVGAGGVQLSSDGGQTFVDASNGLPLRGGLFSIGLAINEPKVYYADHEQGLYRSVTRGESWTLEHPGHPDGFGFFVLEVDPHDARTIYGGLKELYRSEDAGASFTFVDLGLDTTEFILSAVIDPDDRSHILVGTTLGIKRSLDFGSSWSQVATVASVQEIQYSPLDSNEIWAATGTNSANALLKSTDRGATWLPIDNGILQMNVDTITFDPVTPTTMYAGTRDLNLRVFMSTDSGDSWVVANYSNPGAPWTNTISDAITGVYAFGGLDWQRTTDGGVTWTTLPLDGFQGSDFTYRATRIDPLDADRALAPSVDVGLFAFEEVGTNHPPVAFAGFDQSITDDGDNLEVVALDGSNSVDPDGFIATIEWREGGVVLGADAEISVALAVGPHSIELSVTDDDGATDTDTIETCVHLAGSGGGACSAALPEDAAWLDATGEEITIFTQDGSPDFAVEMQNTAQGPWTPATHRLAELASSELDAIPPPLTGNVLEGTTTNFDISITLPGQEGLKKGLWRLENLVTSTPFGDTIDQDFMVLDEGFVRLAAVQLPEAPGDQEIGVRRLAPEPGNADTVISEDFNLRCFANAVPASDRYFYLDLNDDWIARLSTQGVAGVRVVLRLYDVGTSWGRLQYSTSSGTQPTPRYNFTDTGAGIQVSWNIMDTDFTEGFPGSGNRSELRFVRGGGQPFCIWDVRLLAIP